MSSEDRPKFKNHFKCSVDELGPRVRDHDHFRGNYRGPAHAKCNLLMGLNKNRTPFYFHNGGKYDCKVLSQVKNNFYFFKFFFQFIIEHLVGRPDYFRRPRVIGKTKESFLSIDVGGKMLKFIIIIIGGFESPSGTVLPLTIDSSYVLYRYNISGQS